MSRRERKLEASGDAGMSLAALAGDMSPRSARWMQGIG